MADLPNLENFRKAVLDSHNSYRTKHKVKTTTFVAQSSKIGVAAVRLDPKLNDYAQQSAKQMAQKGQMESQPNAQYGENAYCVWSSDPKFVLSGKTPVEQWYSEAKGHKYGSEPTSLSTGHFTQVVWKSTTTIGVGAAKGKDGKIFVVVNYSPPGNYLGQFAANVPPPGGWEPGKAPKAALPKKAQTMDEFYKEGVDSQNRYRAKHGCPPLTLDRKLCDFAQQWADYLGKTNKFEHRSNNNYGENIFASQGSSADAIAGVGAKDAADAWYSEIKFFKFGKEPTDLKAGHFTQMIWKGSKRVGMGVCRTPQHRIIIVANYEPHGNVMTQFSSNVPPPKDRPK